MIPLDSVNFNDNYTILINDSSIDLLGIVLNPFLEHLTSNQLDMLLGDQSVPVVNADAFKGHIKTIVNCLPPDSKANTIIFNTVNTRILFKILVRKLMGQKIIVIEDSLKEEYLFSNFYFTGFLVKGGEIDGEILKKFINSLFQYRFYLIQKWILLKIIPKKIYIKKIALGFPKGDVVQVKVNNEDNIYYFRSEGKVFEKYEKMK